jgi:predicted transcriptional regulator
MKTRRSRLELIMEIIELCRGPGLPLTRLGSEARVNTSKLSDILMELVTGEIISVETRSQSFSDYKRETDFYVRTSEGDELIRDFDGVKKRLSKPGVLTR